MALIIDVETIGLPMRGGLPYGQFPSHEKLTMYDGARIVQVSMMLCNEHFEEIELKDFIVKADGFSIDNSQFHGITQISATQGIPFSEVADVLASYLNQVSHVVAHNANFDLSIINSELYRLGMHSIIAQLQAKHILCTMKHTKMLVKARNSYGIKDPSLAELYTFVFKKNIQNAHNSKYDVINLHSIVKSMHDSNLLNLHQHITYTPAPQCVSELSNDEQQDTPVPSDPPEIDLSKLTLTQLRGQCKAKGIKGYTSLNKNALIEKLNMSSIVA